MGTNALQQVVSTTLQQVATSVPVIASQAMSGVLENDGIGAGFPDISTTEIMEMTQENRTALFQRVLQKAIALAMNGTLSVGDSASISCANAVRSHTEDLAECIVQKTLDGILLAQSAGAPPPKIRPDISKAMVAGFKTLAERNQLFCAWKTCFQDCPRLSTID